MPKISTLKPRISTIDTRQGVGAAVQRIRGYELTKIRERIALRAGYLCEICGRVTGPRRGIVDHKTPLYAGGQERDENRQWLCFALPGEAPRCHDIKSAREEKERAR